MVLFALSVMLYISKRAGSLTVPFGETVRSNAARLAMFERSHGLVPGSYIPSDNGVSLLVQEEDELIAEDDLFWQQYIEPEPLSDEEIAAEEELRAHRADVVALDRAHSLRALVYWLAEGGRIPNEWEVPTKAYLKKIGARGVERLLGSIENEYDELIFDEGWAEYAQERFRVVVFSKVSGFACEWRGPRRWIDLVDLLPILEERKGHSQQVSSDFGTIHHRVGHSK